MQGTGLKLDNFCAREISGSKYRIQMLYLVGGK